MGASIKARAKGWLTNLALALASLLVGLVIAEVGLRIVGFSDPVFWSYDDITGSKLRAGAKGWQRREGEAFVTISSDGLRDREHDEKKPPNTVRVAVLGASMAEALQVPLEQTFWFILERELKTCRAFGDRNIEVLNFGVSGYGTAQELLAYRHRAAAFSPDITVLTMTPAHDVRNNSKELQPTKLSPFFTLRDNELVLDNSFLNDPEYVSFKGGFGRRELLFDLRTFQFVRRLKFVLQQAGSRRPVDGPDAGLALGPDAAALAPPKTPAWRDAWQVTERLILALRDEVRAQGGRLLVLTIPIGIQVDPDPQVRSQFAREFQLDDLWYSEARIGELAVRNQVEAVTLGPQYQSYAQTNRVYLHGFKNTRLGSGHLNEEGHRLIGKALAERLCRLPG